MMAEEHRPAVTSDQPRDHQHRRRDPDEQDGCDYDIEHPLRTDAMDFFAFPRIFWRFFLLSLLPPQLTENCRVEHSCTFATEESSLPNRRLALTASIKLTSHVDVRSFSC